MRSAPPPYGIIYNWDGAPHGYSEYPQSLEQFLDKTFAPIEDTQVGALCYCMGIHEAAWPSVEVLPTTVWPAALTGSTSSTGTAAVTRIVPC